MDARPRMVDAPGASRGARWLGVLLGGAVLGCGGSGDSDGGIDEAVASPDLIRLVDDDGGCGLRTCESAPAECGPIGDGCEDVIDCGGCPSGEFCGGGGFSKCGSGQCKALSCDDQHAKCGSAGDGCGGSVDSCGDCPPGQSCGGGGQPSVCGTGVPCLPRTCKGEGAECGLLADGCGGLLDCGACPPLLVCGTRGPYKCGAPPCLPRSCDDQGIGCGPAGDGCGSTIQCGDCGDPDTCGGGGVPFQCGSDDGMGMQCTPKTCQQVRAACGPVGDGCGGVVQCGDCAPPDTCGGAGKTFQCGHAPVCVPVTCLQLGWNCGPAGDGCGNLLQCGDCPMGQTCGATGKAGVCGTRFDGGVMPGTCDGGMTTVSGVVHAPNGVEPLYNALVFTSAAAPPPFAPGAACDACSREAADALSSLRTGADGAFQLAVPEGAKFLVIQLGRWRRLVDLTKLQLTACADNPLLPDVTRMPKSRDEGDIPQIAIVTGSVDTPECVLRKLGVDDTEFSLPAGGRRIHIYKNNGADLGPGTIDATTFLGSVPSLQAYDMVMLACDGKSAAKPALPIMNLATYANLGGRVFATHFSYTYLDDKNSPFQTTATWMANAARPTANDQTPLVGTIEQDPKVNPKGKDFATWVHLVGADGPMPGTINILSSRHDLNAVIPPAVRWIYTAQPATVQHYTFDTPLAQHANSAPCGRVLFSDFHVVNSSLPPQITFPAECKAGPLTAQEKVLEFMLFDLSSCIGRPPPVDCHRDCFDQGLSCGPAGDGCGGMIQGGCGACPMGQTCGGNGVFGQCGVAPACAPKTCKDLKLHCGPSGDGCGHMLDCGACRGPDGGLCVPAKCAPSDCGPTGDGCGGLIPGGCGQCPNNCTPPSCKDLGFDCGPTADGCGGIIDCGRCTGQQSCGGGGRPNVCGNIG